MTEEKKHTGKHEDKNVEEDKHEHKKEHENKIEEKVETKIEEKKKSPKEIVKQKKYVAVAHGTGLPISTKQSIGICRFIKHKSIDQAIKELNEAILYKRAIPLRGEIPHRKGKGMMSGRYPISASHHFINLLKGLKGNVSVSGLNIDKTKIYIASASWASRPSRSHGRSAKRTNIILKAKEFSGGKV